LLPRHQTWIDAQGLTSGGRDCLASMGISLFTRDVLIDALQKTEYRDFGKEVFPASMRARHVQLHLFDGYWEDIGTIKSFYEANLGLAGPHPAFELAKPGSPIYSRPRFLPRPCCTEPKSAAAWWPTARSSSPAR